MAVAAGHKKHLEKINVRPHQLRFIAGREPSHSADTSEGSRFPGICRALGSLALITARGKLSQENKTRLLSADDINAPIPGVDGVVDRCPIRRASRF